MQGMWNNEQKTEQGREKGGPGIEPPCEVKRTDPTGVVGPPVYGVTGSDLASSASTRAARRAPPLREAV
jgi:hypothetical protein